MRLYEKKMEHKNGLTFFIGNKINCLYDIALGLEHIHDNEIIHRRFTYW
jgi:hypothetical protein